MRVKFFVSYNEKDLDYEINKFISDNAIEDRVIDIKLSTSAQGDSGDFITSALLLYR